MYMSTERVGHSELTTHYTHSYLSQSVMVVVVDGVHPTRLQQEQTN